MMEAAKPTMGIDRRIGVEVPLRPKNQLTLPADVARALGAEPGDRLLVEIDSTLPGTARLRLIRRSYFGAMAGTYGSHEDIVAGVEAERESWPE